MGEVVTVASVLVALAVLVWPSRGGGGAGPVREASPPGALGLQVGRVLRSGRPGWPGRSARGAAWVADFAEVVAVGLDAGLDLGSAALASARSPGVVDRAPWLADRLRVRAGDGPGVSGCLEPPHALADADRRDLALLTAAWRLAEEVGSGAAAVTAAAAGAVRSRRAADERAAVVAAGPRASMWLLTALPIAGPLAGALVGVGPGRLYGSALGCGAAVLGLALTAVGWWWSHTLLARARRPGRTSEGRW